jgi:23S rRNA (cytidine1920-2'-O)/16S rRNA (cytidine1409-2'-O)-methyltransferase
MTIRLDQYLVQNGLAPNIKIAGSLITQGLVHDKNQQLLKAGFLVKQDRDIKVKAKKDHNYVSRGAVKLRAGLEYFGVDADGQICLDIGCSTGGFTEVLLLAGAKLVYSVDVAYGEIHNKLREDPRVRLYERCNARYLTKEQINIPPNIIVCDASFISLKTILPASFLLAAPNFILLALIKPQFEAPKDEVGVKGIITDIVVHQKVCDSIRTWLESEHGFRVLGIIPSPIKGMKGNSEFLICAERHGSN